MKRGNMIETVFKFTPMVHWKTQKKPKKDFSAPRRTIAINTAFEIHQARDISTIKEKFKRLSTAKYSERPKESPPRLGHRRSQSERTIKSALPQRESVKKSEGEVLNKDSIAIFTRELKNHNRFYVDYLVEPKDPFNSVKDLNLKIRPVSAYIGELGKFSRSKTRTFNQEKSPINSPKHNSTPIQEEEDSDDPNVTEKVKSFKNHIKKMERHNSKLEMQQSELNELYDNVSRKKSMSQDEKEFMKLVYKSSQEEVKQMIEHTPKVVRFTDLVFLNYLNNFLAISNSSSFSCEERK